MDSKRYAQVISLAPFVFQTAKCLIQFGILKKIYETNNKATYSELQNQADLSKYSLNILLDAGESCGIIEVSDNQYSLTETGNYLLNDPISKVHMNFSKDRKSVV